MRLLIIFCLVFWVCTLVMTIVVGCGSAPFGFTPKPTMPTGNAPSTPTGLGIGVQRANWLIVPAIVGMALSVGAFVGVPRALQGFVASAFVACAAALGLTLATVRYSGWIAGVSLAGAVGVFIWAVWVRRKATSEIVDTVEVAKQMIPPEQLNSFKQKVRDDIQSTTTTKLVSEVKKDDRK